MSFYLDPRIEDAYEERAEFEAEMIWLQEEEIRDFFERNPELLELQQKMLGNNNPEYFLNKPAFSDVRAGVISGRFFQELQSTYKKPKK